MPRYVVNTRQVFDVTYSVVADSADEAFRLVLTSDGEVPGAVLIDQVPANVDRSWSNSTVESDEDALLDTLPERYRLERINNLPLVFEGWRLSHVDSRDLMGEHQRKHRDRWSDLSIYKTSTGGKWVVAQIGMTRETGGFQPGALIRVCDSPAAVLEALKYRSGHMTAVTLQALNAAIDADPDLAPAREEHIQ